MTPPGPDHLILSYLMDSTVILPLSPFFTAASSAPPPPPLLLTDWLTLWLWLSSLTRTSPTPPSLLHWQVTASSNQPYGERGSSPLLAVVPPASSSILAVFMCTRSRGTSVVTIQPHTFSDPAVPHPPLVYSTGAQLGCHTATLGLGRQVHRPVINWLWFSGRKIPRRAATDFGREKKEKESLVDRTEYITPYILLGDWLFKIPASFPHSIPCSSRRIYPRVYF